MGIFPDGGQEPVQLYGRDTVFEKKKKSTLKKNVERDHYFLDAQTCHINNLSETPLN